MKKQRRLLALVLAFCMCVSLFPTTYAQDVSEQGAVEAFEHEYVFKLSAFNTEKMVKGSSSSSDANYHTKAPVLNNSNGNLYYRPAMDWKFTVPAEYSATEPKEEFPSMNLDATKAWAFEATRVNLGSPYLSGGASGAYFFEYAYNSYTSETPSFVAFRLKVDAPGYYDVSVLSSNRQTDSPVTAVYFFKNGTEGVTNNDVFTYPSSAKLGYYDLYNALKKYKKVGETVEVKEAGEYIIAFVGDAESVTRNTTTIGSTPQQRFYLSGVKLTPVETGAEDVVTAITASAAKTTLMKDDVSAITVNGTYSISGTKAVPAGELNFVSTDEEIIKVSADGKVTAIGKGEATVNISLKANAAVTSHVDFVVDEDAFEKFRITADNTLLYRNGEAEITATEVWSISGEKKLDVSELNFAVSPEEIIEVSADGKVTALAVGAATVTATLKADAEKTATLKFTVADPNAQKEHEYIFGLSAFNKSKMINGSNSRADAETSGIPYYIDAPVLRNTSGGVLYYTPAMHWDYEVPAEYSNTEPKAAFMSMNLGATDPWAFEAHKINWGAPILYDSYYYFEFIRSSYTTATPSFASFKVKVDAPGYYDVSVLSLNRQTHSPVTAVYLFKNGTEGVTNGDVSTYPADAKIGYYDLYNALKKYKVVGEKVKFEEAGEYIISFVGDATSAERNTTTSSNSIQMFYLSGIKLTPVVEGIDIITALSASADDTTLIKGETAAIKVNGTYSVSGEKEIAASELDFASTDNDVITVSADGKVTATGKGEATVNVSLKANPALASSVNFVVDEDTFTKISIKADKTVLYAEGIAKITASEVWSISGEKALDIGAVMLSAAPEGVVTVSADGTVTAVAEGEATVTATLKADPTKSATLNFAVIKPAEQRVYEYILSLSAFNKDKMIMGANSRAEATEDVPYYSDAAVLRNTSGGVLYYTPAMHWDYVVPAKYSNTEPKESFKSMNLSATDPWAFEAHKVNWGSPILYSGMYRFEFTMGSYTTETPSFVAFRLKVDAPGEYILQTNATKGDKAPVPAVYFFKAGIDGVANNDVSTYPTSSKVGYFDIPKNGGAYTTIGNVSVAEPGEYIVAFVGDSTSEEKNSGHALSGSTKIQTIDLTGIKLIPAADDKIEKFTVTADKTYVMKNDVLTLSASSVFTVSGKREVAMSDILFESSDEDVITVSADGVVTAVGLGSAKLTATYKKDTTKVVEIDFVVDENVLTAINAIADNNSLFVDETANILVSEAWTVTGTAELDPLKVTFSCSDEDVITVSAEGVVTAVGIGSATVTVTYNEDPTKTASVSFSVVEIPEQTTQEYITAFNAFNKSLMIMGANSRAEATEDVPYYQDAPVMRNTSGGVFYYQPAMHWNYIVPAKYSNTTPKAEFKAMDLSKTAPWSLEGYKVSLGQALLYDGMFQLEFKPTNYGTDSPSYAAFRLKVDAPGEYIIQAKANKRADAPAPAVYFFRDGTEGVINTDVSTYPAESKLRYFDILNAGGEYVSLGRVNVEAPGEYIVSFVGDETSVKLNAEVVATNGSQNFQLMGIKIIPTSKDEPSGNLEVSAKNQLLMVSRAMQLTLSREYKISGSVDILDFENYTFESSDETVATVDENGIVTGIEASENPVTITVTSKADASVTGAILFKIVPLSLQETYEYKFTAEAFNYDKMGKVPGIVEKVTDDYYRRDLTAEYGFTGMAGIMIMNERLADPELVIPAHYYGEGNPADDFYAMDTTDDDGDPKGTDPWKFVGGSAIDNETTTLLQIRGDEGVDGLHPYFDRTKYGDTADAPFYALSLTVPQPGEYMLTLNAKRHGNAPAPAVYFFKDDDGAYTDISFTENARKLGYFKANDTSKQGYEYIGNVNIPEAGRYVLAFVMDGNCANLADGFLAGKHGAAEAQYISLMGAKLVPSYEDVCTKLSISAEMSVMYCDSTLPLTVSEVWDIAGEKEVLDLSSITFESSDENIAAVDENGVVTGVAPGEVVITATKKNTYPAVMATYAISLYDPNQPILGVNIKYLTGSYVMKDQTTYNPHNDRLDSGGNLRNLNLVNSYDAIDGEQTTLWAYNARGNLTWQCLQKRYFTLATAPSVYEKDPFFALKIRVPMKGEFYFNVDTNGIAWGSEADFYLVPATVATATRDLATSDSYIGTADSRNAGDVRIGTVNVPMPGDYFLIMKFHSDNPNLNESRNEFRMHGFSFVAPPGDFAKVSMNIEGLSGEGDTIPCETVRAFTYTLADAAGVALENVDPADVTVNGIEVTKGADIAALEDRDGSYMVVTNEKEGEVEITADVTYKGENVVTTFSFNVADIGKTGRTIYTDEMVANAIENIGKYDWAKTTRDNAIKNADKVVALGAEYLWNLISGQGLPRSYCVALEVSHPTRDPYEFYCRYCNADLLTLGYGNYPWIVDGFANPWKIKCPECSRIFPSNDFGKFYELGRTQENYGLFDRNTALENHRAMLIEKGLMSEEAINMQGPGKEYSAEWYKYYGYGVKGGYLYNDIYPEVGTDRAPNVKFTPETGETTERWGVDDGYGYNTGRVYDNSCKEVHTYIAYFNHFGVYSFHGTALIGGGGLGSLGTAYLLTGDPKYGRLGAIILDRMADVYPDMEIKPWSASEWRYPNSTGGSPAGKDVGRIWAGFTAEIYADSYDIFYPMFEDPEVIEFLSEKAAYYGLENDKSTAVKIRSNGADGICRAIFDGVKSASIYGNFGIHQGALIKAAIALDDEKDTAAMIDWLYAASSTDSNSFNTGGDVNRRLLETVYRDGMNTESPYYNQMGLSDMIDSAVALERYSKATGGIDRMMLLENPKYLAMFNCFQTLVRVERGGSTIGDTNYPLNYPVMPSEAPLIKAFKNTMGDPARLEENIKMAQQLYLNYGETLKKKHYDIYTKDPESIYEDVMSIINEYGEHDYNKSSIMTGYGFGMLRDGALYDSVGITGIRDTTRGFTLNFSGHHQHNHPDMLDLQIDAYGLPFTYDFGYAEFMVTGDPHSSQLTATTISHNTVVVNEKNSSTPAEGIPQKPLHFDALDTRVKVMDARTPDAYPNSTDDYRRTIVMIDVDDEVSYGVDFFRVDGGKDHNYTFSPSSSIRPEKSENLNFVKQVDEPQDTWKTGHKNYYWRSSYAGSTIQNGEDPGGYGNLKYPRGYTWFYDVERADNPQTGEFWLDWEIEDFRNQSRNPNLKLRLRMTMLNDFDVDEVSLVKTIPQRNSQNEDLEDFEKVIIRRKGTNLDSLFTAVYEPYKVGERYVESITQVDIERTGGAEEGKDDEAQALKVALNDGRIDYVVYATNRDVLYTITDGDYSFDFAGFVGVWTVDANGESVYSYLNDGSTIGAGEAKLENCEAAVTGTVLDFQREYSLDNWIDVEFDRDLTDAEVENLVDRMIIPEREARGNSNYLIEGIEKTGDRTARIDLNSTSTIDGYVDPYNADKGFVYILTGGEKFEIPMSYENGDAPEFEPVSSQSVSVGSMLSVKFNATPATDDLTVTYRARTLPRGAAFDAETATFMWKPSTTQLGKHLVAIDAVDSLGRVSTIYFEVQVFGSTSGGGGGGGAPTKPEEPTEPDEPDEPSDPTDPTEPDEPSEIPEESKKFVDLGNHTWAEDAINALAADGIIKGTSETTFAPASNITRADYAILLVRAFELESDNEENFADVSASDYFARELAVARNTGLVGGIGDNKYAPRDTISRQDMMVIIYRAFDKLGYELKKVDGVDAETFADFDDVADYAKDAVRALVESGLVNGKSGLIAGSDKTTRAEVAVLLKRIIDYIA